MPSPLCTVQDGAAAPVLATSAVDVTPGNTVTIALASAAGVDVWDITCITTDETNSAATVQASLTINSLAKTATFPAPAVGSALLFQSLINRGNDANGPNGTYKTTFKITTRTAGGFRVGALDEQFENDASFGSLPILNSVVREIDGLISGSASNAPVAVNVSAGDVLCSANDNTNEKKLTKATPAALAAGGEVVGYSLATASAGATIAYAGTGTVVSTTITGLSPTSTIQDAIVTSAARTARSTGAYNGGEWIIGRANELGHVRVNPHIVKGRPAANVRQPQWTNGGAKGDAQTRSGIAISASATTFTSSGFTTADIGKTIVIPFAGPVVSSFTTSLVTTISNVVGTTITLAAAATTAVTSVTIWWGTDDTAALQAAHDAVSAAGGGTVHIPPGNYLHTGLVFDSRIDWEGATKGDIAGANLVPIPANGSATQPACFKPRTTGSITQHTRFRGLSLTNYDIYSPPGSIGIDLTECSHCHVEQCVIREFEVAVFGKQISGGGYYNSVRGCVTIGRIGVKLDTAANSWTIDGGRYLGNVHVFPAKNNQVYPDTTTYPAPAELDIFYVCPTTKNGRLYGIYSGTITSVTPSRAGSSTGTVTTGGTPVSGFDVRIKITSSGTGQLVSSGTVTFRYSLDGGSTYSGSDTTIPAGGGPVSVPTTGMTVTFSVSSTTFDLNDVFAFASWKTSGTEPTWSTTYGALNTWGDAIFIDLGTTYDSVMPALNTGPEAAGSCGVWCKGVMDNAQIHAAFEKNSVGIYCGSTTSSDFATGCRFEQNHFGGIVIASGAFYVGASGNDHADGQGTFLRVGDSIVDLDGRSPVIAPGSFFSGNNIGAPRSLIPGKGVGERVTSLGIPQGWLSNAGSMGGVTCAIQTSATPQDHAEYTGQTVAKLDFTGCNGIRDYYLQIPVPVGKHFSVYLWTFLDNPAIDYGFAPVVNVRIDDSATSSPGTTLYSSSLQFNGTAQKHKASGIVSTTGWVRIVIHAAANATNTTVYDGTHQVRNARFYVGDVSIYEGLLAPEPCDDLLVDQPHAIGVQLDCTSGTIAPTRQIHHVTGTGPLTTITPPYAQWGGGPLLLIVDAAWTATTSGNIANFIAPSIGAVIVATFDPISNKWYLADRQTNQAAAAYDINGGTDVSLPANNPKMEIANSGGAASIKNITAPTGMREFWLIPQATAVGVAIHTGGNIRTTGTLAAWVPVKFVQNESDGFWLHT